jgi:hypothetical protein
MLAMRMRLESSDHRDHDIDDASSGGIVMVRTISSERVDRMMSFVGRMMARNAPFGLGRHWVDAIIKKNVSEVIGLSFDITHLSKSSNTS